MCAQPWVFEPGSYACGACGFRRPEPEWRLSGQHVQGPDGRCLALPLQLPGRSNRANALLAIVAAQVRGIEPEPAVAAISALQSVAGRYAVVDHGSGPVRLLLAKNPAGWQEMLAQHTEEAELGQQAADRAHVKADPARPIVLALNAQIADGEDTSWIWDVPFEMLAGTPVVVSGERAEDLAVRLRYAQLPFELVRDPLEAVERARAHAGKPVDLLATYTAFSAVRRSLGLGS
jgi:UDP-N-acetylmuramyl tripeptide synthase